MSHIRPNWLQLRQKNTHCTEKITVAFVENYPKLPHLQHFLTIAVSFTRSTFTGSPSFQTQKSPKSYWPRLFHSCTFTYSPTAGQTSTKLENSNPVIFIKCNPSLPDPWSSNEEPELGSPVTSQWKTTLIGHVPFVLKMRGCCDCREICWLKKEGSK